MYTNRPCFNCGLLEDTHAGGKCLFAPTQYDGVSESSIEGVYREQPVAKIGRFVEVRYEERYVLQPRWWHVVYLSGDVHVVHREAVCSRERKKRRVE